MWWPSKFTLWLLRVSGLANPSPGPSSPSLDPKTSIRACRVQPHDADFPTASQWAQLNASLDGVLASVRPSAGVCSSLPGGFCPLELWQSTSFRKTIPGAMDAYNFEQSYTSNPPSLCFVNVTGCYQGNVPIYGMNATSVKDIQIAIMFASNLNIKLAIKASGHDFLGRSTARNALLIWTQYLRNISYTDAFYVGDEDMGKALTMGSGVSMNAMHAFAAEHDVVVVGGHVADVVVAGGYAQGGGHSMFSPALGLAADNVLQYELVLANGEFVTANAASHPDLFWALRGGGAGSWGVITSITVRAFPMFPATFHQTIILAPTPASAVSLIRTHTRHISDFDALRAGQYFYLLNGAKIAGPDFGAGFGFGSSFGSGFDFDLGSRFDSGSGSGFPGWAFALWTYFPNATTEQAKKAMKPLLDDVKANNTDVLIIDESTKTGPASELLISDDDKAGINLIMTSRLIPEEVYKSDNASERVGEAYEALIAQNVTGILGHVVAGGKVAENANVDNAVHPAWRTAKVHLIAINGYPDNTPIYTVLEIHKNLTTFTTPVLSKLAGGPDSAAYSNEADVNEPNFQKTFFGPNYERLLAVKKKYDPDGLFIVPAGVGSEGWDVWGVCRNR